MDFTDEQLHRYARHIVLPEVGGIGQAKLLEARALALRDGDTEKATRIRNSERYLFREDLSRWIPIFCDKVREATQRPLYSELARLTGDLLDAEGARFGEAGVA